MFEPRLIFELHLKFFKFDLRGIFVCPFSLLIIIFIPNMLWEKRSGFSFAKLVIFFLQLSFLIFLDKKSFSIQSYNSRREVLCRYVRSK